MKSVLSLPLCAGRLGLLLFDLSPEDGNAARSYPGSPADRPFTFVEVHALEAGEDFVEFLQRYYPHLVDSSGGINQGRLIRFDLIPELIQKIEKQIGDKVLFSEGRLIVPKDIPENRSGSGTFQLPVAESQALLSLLQEYGFAASAEKLHDKMGHWYYAAFSVPAIPELELVRMQYRRLA